MVTNINAFVSTATLNQLYAVYGLKGTGMHDDDSKGVIDPETDLLDWISQLSANNGFNPFDYIDEYLPGLEDGPLGDLINDSGIVNSSNKTTVSKLHMDPNDYDYFSYLVHDLNVNDQSTYALDDTKFDLDEDILDGASGLMPASIFYSSYIDWSAGGSTEIAAKSKYYKNLANELEDMQHYTLTNQEMQDIQDKIDNIEDNILPQIQSKIKTATDDYMSILSRYGKSSDPITGHTPDAYNSLLKKPEDEELSTANLKIQANSTYNGVQVKDAAFYDINTLNYDKYDDKALFGVTHPDETATYTAYGYNESDTGYFMYDSDTANASFVIYHTSFPGVKLTDAELTSYPGADPSSTTGTKSYSFQNSLFFEYQAAKRADEKLDFRTFLTGTFTDWSTEKTLVDGKAPEAEEEGSSAEDKVTVDTEAEYLGKTFKLSDYEGVEEGDKKLDMIDVTTDHYIYDEMQSLYSNYEKQINELYSLKLSLEVAAKYCLEFEYRKDMADEVWNDLTTLSDGGDSDAKNALVALGVTHNKIGALERGNDYGPSLEKDFPIPEFYGYYGNTPDPDSNTNGYSTSGSGGLVDPYQFKFNGVEYMMGLDQNGDGTIDEATEILGIMDVYENPFESLVALDTNQDGFVSQSEMKNQNVVFNAVNNRGRLSGSTLDTGLVKGIDLSKLQKANDSNGRLAGTFEVQMSNGKTVDAEQTFEDQTYFNNLFGSLVDLRPFQTPVEPTEEQSVNKLYYDKLMNDLEGIYSGVSESSTPEAMLDEICWETSTILTAAQKVRILEAIDSDMSSEAIEKVIRGQIETLNISA